MWQKEGDERASVIAHLATSFHPLKHSGFTEIPHYGLLSRDKSDRLVFFCEEKIIAAFLIQSQSR